MVLSILLPSKKAAHELMFLAARACMRSRRGTLFDRTIRRSPGCICSCWLHVRCPVHLPFCWCTGRHRSDLSSAGLLSAPTLTRRTPMPLVSASAEVLPSRCTATPAADRPSLTSGSVAAAAMRCSERSSRREPGSLSPLSGSCCTSCAADAASAKIACTQTIWQGGRQQTPADMSAARFCACHEINVECFAWLMGCCARHQHNTAVAADLELQQAIANAQLRQLPVCARQSAGDDRRGHARHLGLRRHADPLLRGLLASQLKMS